jgi:tetratricopeptide (TPR) repeat protein
LNRLVCSDGFSRSLAPPLQTDNLGNRRVWHSTRNVRHPIPFREGSFPEESFQKEMGSDKEGAMQSILTMRSAERRILLLLLAALLILAATVAGRFLSSRSAGTGTPGIRPAANLAPAFVQLSSDLSTEEMITSLRAALQEYPESPAIYAQLGLALLQRLRETADPSLYAQAETAFQEALNQDPQQLQAMIGQGLLALSRHDFQNALQWGQKARALDAYSDEALGVIVDAQVELGRYAEAVESAQAMVDLRPGLASYSRVSYLRELHGDPEGAIEAMQEAVEVGERGSEARAWTQVQLGHLYFNSGNWQQAEDNYRQVLQSQPDYAYALAGLARIEAANGRYEQAIAQYEALVERLPLPEFVIALGELYQLTGQHQAAGQQYELVRAIQQLNASAGMDVDLELALFDANHGDAAPALEKARAAYERRPTIYAADILAWALYKNGAYDEAERMIQEALRLGTRDALMHFHAGKIAEALGDEVRAMEHFETALAINPAFSILDSQQLTAP